MSNSRKVHAEDPLPLFLYTLPGDDFNDECDDPLKFSGIGVRSLSELTSSKRILTLIAILVRFCLFGGLLPKHLGKSSRAL